jgi:O-antigen ligase
MAIGAAALVGLVFIYAPPTYFQRMELIKSYETEGSAQGRIMAWKAGVRMALDHPILGVGAGHFPVKFGVEYRPPQFGRTEIPWLTAHSIYFLVLGELGFPGLAVLLVLIGSNLVANRRVQLEIEEWEGSARITDVRLLVCLSASLIAFAVAGAFLTAIYYPHIYVLSGLLAAARRIVRDRLRTSESVGREPQSALPKYDLALR